MTRISGNETGVAEFTGRMIPLNLVRHVAAAFISLFGYPRTIGHELRGRMLG
jgi:hypothetical protein